MSGRSQSDADPSRSDVLERVAEAYHLRAPLHADPQQTAYRLFHGHGEGVPGLYIDRLGDALVVTRSETYAPLVDDVLDLLEQLDMAMACVVARPHRGPGPPQVVRGPVPTSRQAVLDNGLRYEVDLLSPGSVGLYLDARPARAWLLANATGRRVLNLFAYTGSLGLAAAAGGARWVMHVEMQKRALRRLKRNYHINALQVDDRDLVRADLYPHLRRLARKDRLFEAVILDPPPQVPGREPRGQDYSTLARLTADVLAPGGWLLCFFSSYRKTRSAYEEDVLAASPHPLEVIWRGTSGIDFPESDPEAKLRMTAFSRPPA